MKRKVAFARALAIDPKLLLMDEPFVSLDAQSRNLLQQDLLNLWKQTKKTIIFVTHNVDEAVYLSDRILVFSARPGKIVGEFRIEIPRPRCRTSKIFNKIRAKILALLAPESDL